MNNKWIRSDWTFNSDKKQNMKYQKQQETARISLAASLLGASKICLYNTFYIIIFRDESSLHFSQWVTDCLPVTTNSCQSDKIDPKLLFLAPPWPETTFCCWFILNKLYILTNFRISPLLACIHPIKWSANQPKLL